MTGNLAVGGRVELTKIGRGRLQNVLGRWNSSFGLCNGLYRTGGLRSLGVSGRECES